MGVTYSADGERLYAAYALEDAFSPGHSGPIVVSVSSDHGATWSTPIETPLGGGDGTYLDVRLAAAPDAPWLYVAAILRTEEHQVQSLVFSRSGDRGASWNNGKTFVTDDPRDMELLLRGFAMAAGRSGHVLVAYGLYLGYPSFSETVQVARSADHGASFVYGTADRYGATDDGSTVLSQPDIEIGPKGTAHLVYGKGENYFSAIPEAILYKYSVPPYETWRAAPIVLADNAGDLNIKLSNPRLAATACGQATVLHASWVENGTDDANNIFYTRKLLQRDGGHVWSNPLKVGTSKHEVRQNELVGAGGKAFSSWETFPVSANNWSIFGSCIWSGISCP